MKKIFFVLLLFTFQARAQFFGSLAADDYNAAIFYSNVSATDNQKDALNWLVKDYKADNVWTGKKRIFPIIGGTSSTHAFDLKTNVSVITWVGSPTHSSTGMDPNGSSQYGNLGVAPSILSSANSTSITFYSGEDAATNGIYLGVTQNSPSLARVYMVQSGASRDIYTAVNITNDHGTPNATPGTVKGYHVATRTSSTVENYAVNGSSFYSKTNTANRLPTINMYLNARNINGAADNYCPLECRFASFGDGMTQAQADADYRAVLRFETKLGRQ